jgi:hypothetical protein
MILEDHWWNHHQGLEKPLELCSEGSRDGKLVYHLEIFLGWVEKSVDTLLLMHEDHFIEKMVFWPRPRWWIVQTQTHEVHRMAKLRSWGEVKFMSSTIIVPYLVWVEQYMALTQKETPPPTAIMDIGKGTFGSPATCVPFLVWLGQEWLFDQKDAFSKESSP